MPTDSLNSLHNQPTRNPQCAFGNRFFEAYQQTMGQLNWLLFLALVIALPYNRFILQPLWVAWFATWVLEARWLSCLLCHPKQTDPKIRKAYFKGLLPALSLAAFVIWEAVSSLWSASPSLSWTAVGHHVGLLILPLVLWVGFNEYYDWQRVMRAFIYGAVVSVLVYAFSRFWVDNYRFAFHWDTEIHPFRPFDIVDLTLCMKHRLFYCMNLTMALVFMGGQWRYFLNRLGNVVGGFAFIGMAVLILWGVWATSSRQSLLTLAILAFIALVFAIFRWTTTMKQAPRIYTRLGGACVLVLILALSLFFVTKHHPRFSQLQTSYFTDEYEQHLNDASFEPRIAFWHVVLESRDEYPIYGLGAGQSTPFLIQHYQDRGWVEYAYHEFNAHNQYFQIWMELGILAVLLFVLLWVIMPWCYQKRNYATYFVVMMMLSMVTDTTLGVVQGIIFICVLLIILDLYNRANISSL